MQTFYQTRHMIFCLLVSAWQKTIFGVLRRQNLIFFLAFVFQLDKIFRVVGTPNEDIWPGVSSLPNYKPHKLCYYPPPTRLGEVWPRLVDVPFAESLATLLLQQKAQKRTGADQALRHRYFAELPHKILELGDGKCR